MSGIYWAALLTTALAGLVYGLVIFFLRQPVRGRALLLAFLVALPLEPLVFYLMRVPFDRALASLLDSGSMLYTWLTAFYAPLTEEPAKLVPLLIPLVYRDIRRENFVRYALAIGLAFGIGEIWFVAERVARAPVLAALPFWQFGGFVTERMMVCLMHGAFVALPLWRLRRGLILGLFGAMALHYLGNLPILLMNLNVAGLGRDVWTVLVSLWVQFFFVASILLLVLLAAWALLVQAAHSPALMRDGVVSCPDCGHVTTRSALRISLGRRRYDRCPACGRWHLVTITEL